ncbi:SDR family NAD(P)-dependent oxidoreductase [Aurantivibrio plasticivorans]
MIQGPTMMQGEVIWITGASSGIGQALARTLSRSGNTIVATARNNQALEELAAQSSGIHVLTCDVTDQQQMQDAKDWIDAKFGYIDRVIINAGVCEYFDIDTPDWDAMKRVMDVNYFGAVNTVSNALPLLEKSSSRSRQILVTSSLANVVPFPRAEAYGASKAAVHYFFESLRIDLAETNIAVSIIQPGFVKTPMTDANDFSMPFIVSTESAVKCIVKEMKEKRRLITFPKRFAVLLYSLRCFPKLWHWLAVNKLSRETQKEPAK